jgi:hypothetical protein
MGTNYRNILFAAILMIAMGSCRSESQHTSNTALATLSGVQTDRVFYIERGADKFTKDLLLHLRLVNEVEQQSPRAIKVNNNANNYGQAPTHIGPFLIEHARPIKREAWNFEKLIIEWIFTLDN